MRFNRPRVIAGVVVVLTALAACGKKNASSPAPAPAPAPAEAGTETNGGTGGDTDETSASAGMASAFPGTLALSVFPESTGSSLRLLEDGFDPNAQDPAEKAAEQQKFANGTAADCLPPALANKFTKKDDEKCYEFDQDMIYGTNDANQQSPKFLGTRDGKNSDGEACLVAFTRNQVAQTVAILDQTLAFGMAAGCQYKKDKGAAAKMPELGEEVDATESLATLMGDKATVTSATMSRLADKDGKKVFKTVIASKMGRDSIERTVGIIHSPADDKNEEYSGTIYTKMKGVPSFGPAGQSSGQSGKYQYMSVTYKRTKQSDGTFKITAELRSAQIASALDAEAITDAGLLDLNVGTNIGSATIGSATYGNYTGYSQSNDAIGGITFVAFDLNAESNEGTLAYWKNPGGNYYENARGFNISIAKNADGELEGCATSGAASTNFSNGVSIRRYLNAAEASNKLTLAPKGFWHPFMNTPSSSGSDANGSFKLRSQQSGQQTKWYVPDVGDTTLANTFVTAQDGSLITRQCFKQNSEGVYVIDTSKVAAAAGYELVDTGNASMASKQIGLPPPPPPPGFEGVKPK